MTAAAQTEPTDDTPVESGDRRKRPRDPHGNVLDHLRWVWIGPKGELRQPAGETWLDREARVLTVLLLLAWGGRVTGLLLPFLLRKARLSRSDWFRALRVLVAAGVVSIKGDKTRDKAGKVRSVANEYILHPEQLLAWTGKDRPAHWPTDASPRPEKPETPPAGAYELALEEARDALGLGKDDLAAEFKAARKRDAEARAITATEERLNRELARLVERRRFHQERAAVTCAEIAEARARAGLPAAPVLTLVPPPPEDEHRARETAGAPASDQPETNQDSEAHREYTKNLRMEEPGLTHAIPDGSTSATDPGASEVHREYTENLRTEPARPVAAPAPKPRYPGRPNSEPLPGPMAPVRVVSLPAAPPPPAEGADPTPESPEAELARLLAFAERVAPTSTFATGAMEYARRTGSLTPAQLATLRQMVREDAARKGGPGPHKTDPMKIGLQPEALPGQHDWQIRDRRVLDLRTGNGDRR